MNTVIQNQYKILVVEDDANIRRKLGAQPGEVNYIINELGVGYRMNGERE